MGATRKILIFLAVVILLIVGLPYIIPLNVFLTDGLERTISTKLQRRVTLGDVEFKYQPYPTLILENVQIGPAAADGTVSSVELQLDLLTAFSEAKRLRKFVLNEASLTQEFLQQIPELLKPGANTAGTAYVTRKIEVLRGIIRTDKKQYGPVEAEISLNPDQSFEKVVLFNSSRSVEVQIKPLKQSYSVILSAKNWEVPAGPKPIMEALVLEGKTQGQSLLVENVTGRVAGGSFKGQALLDWTNGWVFSARLNMTDINGETVTKWFSPRTNLTGTLNGAAEVSTSSETLDTLFKTPSVHLNFDSKNGTLNNFDFVTPIRSNIGTEGKRGGSTRYDYLSGSLSFAGDRITVNGVQLKSGLLTVSANMRVDKNKLSGAANVSLGQGVNRRSLPLRLAGEFDNPLLIPPSRAGRESSVVTISE